MTCKEQLDEWVTGNSIHNTTRDECCHDFSGCNIDVRTPQDVKERFVKAYEDKDEAMGMNMLMMFLGSMLAKETVSAEVHIAGDVKNGGYVI